MLLNLKLLKFRQKKRTATALLFNVIYVLIY
jgi:hypothetical protein